MNWERIPKEADEGKRGYYTDLLVVMKISGQGGKIPDGSKGF
jgi:hypothetical protein